MNSYPMANDLTYNLLKLHNKLKRLYPGVLIWFEVDDLVHVIGDDATDTALILSTALTEDSRTGIPETEFPKHSLEKYMRQIVKTGRSVATCSPLN
jgi:DNA mismatch repair ATPase MutS